MAPARVTRSAGRRPTHIAFTSTLSRYGLVEDGLAADRGHADGVPVGADAGDGAVEARVVGREAEPVQQRDRPRPHGDDVAQDPAHTGRGTLEGLDRGGMVVALDLEADGLAVAEIEHAGVLTGTLQDAFTRGGKPLEEEGRVLVAAVLRPEEREDRQLEMVRFAAEQVDDTRELPVGQAGVARWMGCSATCVR